MDHGQVMNTGSPRGNPRAFDSREEESIDLNYYMWMLRRGKWIVLSCVLAGLLAAGYVNATTVPVYRSSASFIYTSDNSMARTLDMPGTAWFQMDAIRNDQIHLINSRVMAEMVADSILQSPDSDSLVSILFSGSVPGISHLRNSLVGVAQSRVSVSWIKDTDFFIITGVGYSPDASAVITNLMLHVYYRWNQRQARGENREIRLFLEEQLEHISLQLENSEAALKEFKETTGVTDIDTETRNLINNLANLETQAGTAIANAEASAVRRNYLTGLLSEQQEIMEFQIAEYNSEYVRQIQNDLAGYESARASLLAQGALPDSDPVAAIDSRIETRRSELIQALGGIGDLSYPYDPQRAVESLSSSIAAAQGEYLSNMTRARALEQALDELSQGLVGLPEMQYSLIALERNRKVNENIYILLRTRFEEVRIAEVGQMGNVTIVDTALPGGMIRPTTRRNLIMGILVGLAAGVGLVFFINQIDTTVRSPEHLEKFGIPLFAVVPRFQSKSDSSSITVSVLENPKSPAAESIRDIRTSLGFVRPDKPLKKLLITSSGPQEGKSSICANLAVTEAQAGKKVILLDCDLRRPMVNRIFDFPRKPGFSELVTGKAELDDVIRQTGVDGLQAICSGHVPPNPSEIIEAGVRMGLFDRIAARCDLLIIDSPPAAVVTDAVSIAPQADTVILISRCGKVQQKVVQGVWQKLHKTGAHLAGAVINEFDPVRTYTSYTYYTYRYQYYYEESKPKN
jgi:polysaccharide biosynthesis transport protein